MACAFDAEILCAPAASTDTVLPTSSPEDGQIMYHPEAGLDDEENPTSRFLDDMTATIRMFLSSFYRNRGLHWCARERLFSSLMPLSLTVRIALLGTTDSSMPDPKSSGHLSSTSRRTAF